MPPISNWEQDGHTDVVRSVSFSPDGSRIATGSDDKSVKIWDLAAQEEILMLNGARRGITSVAFSPDGTWIAACGPWDPIKVWDVNTGKEVLSLEKGSSPDLSVSHDGTMIAACLNEFATVYNVKEGSIQRLSTTPRHNAWISAVSFSPDGTRILTGCRDASIRLWDPSILVRTSGLSVAVGVEMAWKEVAELHGHNGQVDSVSFSPDGQRVVTGSSDNTVRVWDLENGVELFRFRGHTEGVSSVAYSPGGTLIGSAGADAIKLWDAVADQKPLTLRGHTSWISDVAFSPDGTRIASSSDDGTVRVWDAATGQGPSHFKDTRRSSACRSAQTERELPRPVERTS